MDTPKGYCTRYDYKGYDPLNKKYLTFADEGEYLDYWFEEVEPYL